MDKIEAICALVSAIAAILGILGGVWLIVRQALKSGVNARRLEEIKGNTSNLH
jgi:hypothetical protein